MKRRSFFKTLFGAVASIALAQKIALEPIALRADEPKWIPNPSYQNAEYEVAYIWNPEVFSVLASNGSEVALKSASIAPKEEAKRYTFKDGEFMEVEQMILS